MIDAKNIFDQLVKNNKVAYENIRKIATGRGETIQQVVCQTISTLKKYYRMIAVNLSKQKELDVDPKTIQQIDFTANIDRVGNTRFYFIFEEAKETVFEFSQGTVKVL